MARDHPGWDPDWIRGSFHGALCCPRQDCGKSVAVVGEMRVEYVAFALPAGAFDGYGGPDTGYDEMLLLRYAHPQICAIDFPDDVPAAVKDRVAEGVGLLFVDANAAAGRVRVAVEELLTELRIPRFTVNKQKRRTRLSLHARLERLGSRSADAVQLLEAVKWIGNDGSHQTTVDKQDVILGLELLEKALHLLFDRRSSQLARMAQTINRRRTARKPRQRRSSVS